MDHVTVERWPCLFGGSRNRTKTVLVFVVYIPPASPFLQAIGRFIEGAEGPADKREHVAIDVPRACSAVVVASDHLASAALFHEGPIRQIGAWVDVSRIRRVNRCQSRGSLGGLYTSALGFWRWIDA